MSPESNKVVSFFVCHLEQKNGSNETSESEIHRFAKLQVPRPPEKPSSGGTIFAISGAFWNTHL